MPACGAPGLHAPCTQRSQHCQHAHLCDGSTRSAMRQPNVAGGSWDGNNQVATGRLGDPRGLAKTLLNFNQPWTVAFLQTTPVLHDPHSVHCGKAAGDREINWQLGCWSCVSRSRTSTLRLLPVVTVAIPRRKMSWKSMQGGAGASLGWGQCWCAVDQCLHL